MKLVKLNLVHRQTVLSPIPMAPRQVVEPAAAAYKKLFQVKLTKQEVKVRQVLADSPAHAELHLWPLALYQPSKYRL
jgi:hypothetical protein